MAFGDRKLTSFHTKPRKPLARTAIKTSSEGSSVDSKAIKGTKAPKVPRKRKKKTRRQKANDKVWELCKQIIRQRYPNICYTCGAQGLEAQNWQTGHGKPKGSLPVRYEYDLRNLKPQCMLCNLHNGGVSDIFINKLQKEEDGLAFLQEACRETDEGWIIKKESDLYGIDATIFIEDLIEQYKALLDEVQETN